MPLRDLELPPSNDPVPADVVRFIREAERRIDEFQLGCRVPGFVQSDYTGGYRLLHSLSESGLPRGRQFCEWGSGFGVVASLAAMLDFDSCGIEVEDMLVTEARRLADDFDLTTEFAVGSFIPPGAETRVNTSGNYSWFTTDADYAYDDLGLEPKDMDVVFAYPWPDEEAVTAELFDRYAGVGAILVTFHGGDEFRVRRKSKPKKRPK